MTEEKLTSAAGKPDLVQKIPQWTLIIKSGTIRSGSSGGKFATAKKSKKGESEGLPNHCEVPFPDTYARYSAELHVR